MQNENHLSTKLAIHEQFTHVIYRTVAILLLRDIDYLMDEYIRKHPYATDDDFWFKCAQGKYKHHVMQKVNSIAVQKEDIVAEVMKNYGMQFGPDAKNYHDIIMSICNEAIDVAKLYVKADRYDGILLMSTMKPPGAAANS